MNKFADIFISDMKEESPQTSSTIFLAEINASEINAQDTVNTNQAFPPLQLLEPAFDNTVPKPHYLSRTRLEQFARDIGQINSWAEKLVELSQQPQDKDALTEHFRRLESAPMKELLERTQNTFKENYVPSELSHLNTVWDQAEDSYNAFLENADIMKTSLKDGERGGVTCGIAHGAQVTKTLMSNLSKCLERITLEDPIEVEKAQKVQESMKVLQEETKELHKTCHPFRDLYDRFAKVYDFSSTLGDTIKDVHSGVMSKETLESELRKFVIVSERLKAQINKKDLYSGIEARTDISSQDKADFIALRDQAYECLPYIEQAITMLAERNQRPDGTSNDKELSKIFKTIAKKSHERNWYTPDFYLSDQDTDPRLIKEVENLK